MATPAVDRISRIRPAAGALETRTDALEVKFVVDYSLGDPIRAWAREHLTADPHGTGVWGDEYRTTSVYLDTEKLDVFNRRGSYGRSKYRVRRYGNDQLVYLERKLRTARRLVKRRSPIPIDRIGCLAVPAARGASDSDWFVRRLEARRLHPVCQVAYHRMARYLPGTEGSARLTLDADIRARPLTAFVFEDGADLPVLDGKLILEMKFRRYMPAPFKELVERFVIGPAPCSKYRLAAGALNLEWDASARTRSSLPSI